VPHGFYVDRGFAVMHTTVLRDVLGVLFCEM
jgi:hypothetical protein